MKGAVGAAAAAAIAGAIAGGASEAAAEKNIEIPDKDTTGEVEQVRKVDYAQKAREKLGLKFTGPGEGEQEAATDPFEAKKQLVESLRSKIAELSPRVAELDKERTAISAEIKEARKAAYVRMPTHDATEKLQDAERRYRDVNEQYRPLNAELADAQYALPIEEEKLQALEELQGWKK